MISPKLSYLANNNDDNNNNDNNSNPLYQKCHIQLSARSELSSSNFLTKFKGDTDEAEITPDFEH